MPSSNLFVPYKATGLVCDGQQLALQYLGTEGFLTTSIGKAFQVYNLEHLNVALVSRPLTEEITHVAVQKEITFAATESAIIVYRRAAPFRTLSWSSSSSSFSSSTGVHDNDGTNSSTTGNDDKDVTDSSIVQLLCIGDYLLSLHQNHILRIWDIPSIARNDTLETILLKGISLLSLCLPTILPTDTTNPKHSTSSLSSVPTPAVNRSRRSTIQFTALFHPDTYINKIIVSSNDGSLFLINIRNTKLIHECRIADVLPKSSASIALPFSNHGIITTLCQSPVVDVIAIGYQNGTIQLYNIRTDESISVFNHGSKSNVMNNAITSLAFNYDNILQIALLVSCNEQGSIAFWNLDTSSLRHFLPSAHDSHILFCSFLPNQPCLLTAGKDNAVKIWLIDRLDNPPKLLKFRTGHSAPPRIIRYYGGTSATELDSGADARVCEIASAGTDRCLRLFHTALDRQNCELSQGHLTARAQELGVHPSMLRLPPITAMAVSDRRHAQWADVITAHAGDSKVYCWSWENKRLENRTLVLPNPQETVTAVNISSCGHFAIIGGTNGTVCKFNLQNGGRKGTYPKDPRVHTSFAAKGKKRKGPLFTDDFGAMDRDTGRGFQDRIPTGTEGAVADSIDTSLALAMGIVPTGKFPASAAVVKKIVTTTTISGNVTVNDNIPIEHKGSIYGIVSDLLNTTLVSLDSTGLLVFWDFETYEYRSSIQLPSTASQIILGRDSNLLAIAGDDFVIRIIDIVTRRQVRTFKGHTNRITDMSYSPDGRWLLSSSLDYSIRVWDLPMARCIDWMMFSRAPTSITFSPTSEYLVTSHTDSLALYMWANKAHFSSVLLNGQVTKGTPMDMPQANSQDTQGKDSSSYIQTIDNNESSIDKDTNKRVRIHHEPSNRSTTLTNIGSEEEIRTTTTMTMEGSNTREILIAQTITAPSKPGCHITLSGLPQSAWINLDKLDILYERNKPKEPPKKPEDTPFFLSTIGGTNPTFVAPSTTTNETASMNIHNSDENDEGAWEGIVDGEETNTNESVASSSTPTVIDPSSLVERTDPSSLVERTDPSSLVERTGRHIVSKGRIARSKLATLLRELPSSFESSNISSSSSISSTSGDTNPALPITFHLASLSPVAIDVEIRTLCLGIEDNDGIELLGKFLDYLIMEFRTGLHYDIIQAYLALFLQIYNDVFVSVPELNKKLEIIQNLHQPSSVRLRSLIDNALCLVSTYLGQ